MVSNERLAIAAGAIVLLTLVAHQMLVDLNDHGSAVVPKISISDVSGDSNAATLIAKLRTQVAELQKRLAGAESEPQQLLGFDSPMERSSRIEPLIRKTQFSDRLRFMFFAGVEGTGHHYWTALWPLCGESCYGSRDLTSYTGSVQGTALGGFPLPADITSMADGFRKTLQCIAGMRDGCTLIDGHLAVLNTHTLVKNMGMMSYPNYGGPNKAIRHPDVHLLARLAEEAGVDLRVVVIIRDPTSVMVSTTINRQFNKFHVQLRMLADNQAVLLQQLREIDRRFWACHDFDANPQVACKGLSDIMGVASFPDPWDLCNDMTAMRKAADDRHKIDGKEPPKKDPRDHFDADELQLLQSFYRVYNATKELCFVQQTPTTNGR